MKKLKFIVLFLLLGTIFVGCNFGKKEDISKMKVEFTTNKESSEKYSYDIVLPQITGVSNEDIDYFNTNMTELTNNITKNMIVSNGEGDFINVIILSKEYKNSFGILSIGIDLNLYFKGGAHGDHTFQSYNFDKKTNNLVSFENLFTTEDIKFYNKYINKMIKDGKKVYNTNGNAVIFFDDAEANINDSAFYFDGDDLVFVFGLYSLAPYSSGMPTFRVPKNLVDKHIHIN